MFSIKIHQEILSKTNIFQMYRARSKECYATNQPKNTPEHAPRAKECTGHHAYWVFLDLDYIHCHSRCTLNILRQVPIIQMNGFIHNP